MLALVAGIHDLGAASSQHVDGRNKSGHDEIELMPAYSRSAKKRISRGARKPDRLPGSSIGSLIQ
jgi:hypothetical protein